MNTKAGRILAAAFVLVCAIVVGLSLKLHANAKPKLKHNAFDFILANLNYSGNRLNAQAGQTLLLYSQTSPQLSKPISYKITLFPRSFCCGLNYAWFTDDNGNLAVLNLQSHTTLNFKVPVTQGVVSCDDTGSIAVFAGWNGDVAVCRPFGLTWIHHDPSRSLGSVSVSGDGQYGAVANQDNVTIWNIKTRKLVLDKKEDVDMDGLSWDPSVNAFWDANTDQYIRQIDPTKKTPMGAKVQILQTMDSLYRPRVLKRHDVVVFTFMPIQMLSAPPPGGHIHLTIDPDNMGYQTVCRVHNKTVFKKPSLAPSIALRADGKEFAYISDAGVLTVVPIPPK